MISRIPWLRLISQVAILGAIAGIGITPARAGDWNLIYTDRLDVTLCQGCGVTLAGKDHALFVNTGSTPIQAAEFFGGQYQVVSSQPGITLTPFINDPNSPQVAPILPGEAVGSVIDASDAVTN